MIRVPGGPVSGVPSGASRQRRPSISTTRPSASSAAGSASRGRPHRRHRGRRPHQSGIDQRRGGRDRRLAGGSVRRRPPGPSEGRSRGTRHRSARSCPRSRARARRRPPRTVRARTGRPGRRRDRSGRRRTTAPAPNRRVRRPGRPSDLRAASARCARRRPDRSCRCNSSDRRPRSCRSRASPTSRGTSRARQISPARPARLIGGDIGEEGPEVITRGGPLQEPCHPGCMKPVPVRTRSEVKADVPVPITPCRRDESSVGARTIALPAAPDRRPASPHASITRYPRQ